MKPHGMSCVCTCEVSGQEITIMRVLALVSGGKDSCYNMMKCVAAGHEIVALANLQPEQELGGRDNWRIIRTCFENIYFKMSWI